MKKKWIWQDACYPDFKYDSYDFISEISKISYDIGLCEGVLNFIDDVSELDITTKSITDDIVSNSLIEGELLQRESIRSSVRKKIDPHWMMDHDNSTQKSDILVDLFIDIMTNKKEMTKQRLSKYNKILVDKNNFFDVHPGKFRDYDDMQIVSGAFGKEKVHYQAPAAKDIEKDLNKLLYFINNSKEHPFIKSAVSHFWFVTIHPFGDGNGRLGRLIADFILSKEIGNIYRFFSISSQINKDKKRYYELLEKHQNIATNPQLKLNDWIYWHLGILEKAINETMLVLKKINQKIIFWQNIKDIELNSRQKKVITKLLDFGIDNFKGGLSTKKYVSMTKVSEATAKRDISALLKMGILVKEEGSNGRNTRYQLSHNN